MPLNRLFFLDAEGKIAGREEMDCIDDATAVSSARAKHPDYALEIWSGAHMIATLPGNAVAPMPPLVQGAGIP